jgi:hypothetical protein
MYQIVWLGDRNPRRVAELSSTLEERMRDLGVDAATFLATSQNIATVDWRYPVAGVWFASEKPVDPADELSLSRLLSEGCTVFPVVDDLADFDRLVPADLRGINGFDWRSEVSRLVDGILRACGLTREQRSAFISYRRSDSRAVAVQLFHRLSDQGYRAFLDTASVDYGVRFQETLWDRMSDADLLVFLDTPGALSSRWVEAELTRANNLGLGTLQVVWPGWRPFAGTELCTRFVLADTDFRAGDSPYPPSSPGSANPEGHLGEAALDKLVEAAESVRMRSLGSRRARIVGEIVDEAARRGLRATVDPRGPVTLADARTGREIARAGKAMPVIGLPSGETIFGATVTLAPGGKGVRLVYDGLGMSPERRRLLDWLNRQVPDFRSVPIDAIDGWLDELE